MCVDPLSIQPTSGKPEQTKRARGPRSMHKKRKTLPQIKMTIAWHKKRRAREDHADDGWTMPKQEEAMLRQAPDRNWEDGTLVCIRCNHDTRTQASDVGMEPWAVRAQETIVGATPGGNACVGTCNKRTDNACEKNKRSRLVAASWREGAAIERVGEKYRFRLRRGARRAVNTRSRCLKAQQLHKSRRPAAERDQRWRKWRQCHPEAGSGDSAGGRADREGKGQP